MTGAPGSAPTPPTPLPVDRAVRYVLRMGSDWHTGTGAGIPGGIDRLVARDEAGLPYVPAKTLTGVWGTPARSSPGRSTALRSARGDTG